VIKYLSVNW